MESSEAAAPHQHKDGVKVAVNIRPLITPELLNGCTDCVTVTPGEPQVQIGPHVFTYDHVYGSTGAPSSLIFEQCVHPLIDSFFCGYNTTMLAYGQTGSGKTYTMGTNYTDEANCGGIIPQVMETIFRKVDAMKDDTEFLITVSFIEIFKEEVFDLLDDSGSVAKATVPARVPIQIRETANGGITLAGVTEAEVKSKVEMASYLVCGSLSRATGSTNMNSQSSRSHAIFTICIKQKRASSSASDKSARNDYNILSSKFHLVDLAGSERAKRTGADGLRLKEGIHINRGLLALGNVISALGDEKKRKEGAFVPYRDSKLTRLLQDSLGGNSKTVMIACISPADSNAEETINTLKYANRACNIQNKAVINRDPATAELQKLRSQLEQLQTELLFSRSGSAALEELQLLQQKNSLLERKNSELNHELKESKLSCEQLAQSALAAQDDVIRFPIEKPDSEGPQLISRKRLKDSDESLEVKYAAIFVKAARTNSQEMKFLSAAEIKKLPKADASLAVKSLDTRSTSNYTAMRTTNPYFDSEGNLNRRQCSDQRFWNDQQQSSYHLLIPKKGFVDSMPIDWDNLAKNGLGELKDILTAVQLDQICSTNQGYDSEVIKEFYAIVFVEQDHQDYMLWMTRGQLLCITAPEFAELFNLPSGPKLSTINTSKGSEEDKSLQSDWVPNETRQKFFPTGYVFPTVKGVVPKFIQHFKGLMKTPKHIVKILNVSICAKGGGTDAIYNSVWRILELISKKEKFDVARYIFSEINECQKNRSDKMRYGSYLMHMILQRIDLATSSFFFDKKCFLSKFRPQKDDNEDEKPFYSILVVSQPSASVPPESATRATVRVPQPAVAPPADLPEPPVSPARDSARDSSPPELQASVSVGKARQDELKQEMTELKDELKADMADLKADMADLKASVSRKFDEILSILQQKPAP